MPPSLTMAFSAGRWRPEPDQLSSRSSSRQAAAQWRSRPFRGPSSRSRRMAATCASTSATPAARRRISTESITQMSRRRRSSPAGRTAAGQSYPTRRPARPASRRSTTASAAAPTSARTTCRCTHRQALRTLSTSAATCNTTKSSPHTPRLMAERSSAQRTRGSTSRI